MGAKALRDCGIPDNRGMPVPSAESSRHLLVPFAAASAPECQALLPGLVLPRLSALLALLTETGADRGDDHSFTPPHERALARTLGLPMNDGAIPWAAAQSEAPTTPQAFFSLCHYQVGMDQVLLLPGASLALDVADSRALFDAFAPLCAEDGISLRWDGPTEWHASGEALGHIASASLDRASGRNARDWMLRATHEGAAAHARLLQRLQSEAQMLFYSHPVHDARTAQGRLAVNGFWVHGAGALTGSPVLGEPPAMPDGLRQAALRSDWRAWQTAWQALDQQEIADLLAAAQRGEPVTLTLCGERHARTWTTADSGALTRLGRAVRRLFGTPPAGDTLKDL